MKLLFPTSFLLGLSYTLGECPDKIETTTCDYASLSAQLTGCDLATELDISTDDLQLLVEEICDDVSVKTLSWTDVTKEAGNPRNYQWDNNYFDGGTSWNDETETVTEALHAGDAGSIIRTWMYHADNKRIGWPTDDANNEYYGKNFEGCDARIVTCCFTEARLDEALPVNADMCNHDLHKSRDSNHIHRGMAMFEGDQKAYCTGFAWEEDEDSVSAQYKGNALFYASMYHNLYENGYVQNIPSSPLCACVEQMATVTNADCVKVSAVEGGGFEFLVDYDDSTLTVGGKTDVTYGTCDEENLVEHYKTIASEEEVAELTTEHIVSDCGSENEKFANENFYVPGTNGEYFDESKWTLIVGKGKYYSPPVGETAFRDAIEASPNKIIRRICYYCSTSHKDIYYKRITEIPSAEEYDFLANFMDDWFSTPDNVLNTDFELYSTYEDALSGDNKWTFCNYNDNGVGFPRDCGPTGSVGGNWNSYRRSNWRADTHVFLVEKPDAASDVE